VDAEADREAAVLDPEEPAEVPDFADPGPSVPVGLTRNSLRETYR
jgi:hypothetical protein